MMPLPGPHSAHPPPHHKEEHAPHQGTAVSGGKYHRKREREGGHCSDMSRSDSAPALGGSQATGPALPITRRTSRSSLPGQAVDMPHRQQEGSRCQMRARAPRWAPRRPVEGFKKGNTKGNKMQTKEEKPRLKNKSSITPEASTWTPVPVAAGGISHVCPSEHWASGHPSHHACPILAELRAETSCAARAQGQVFPRHPKC